MEAIHWAPIRACTQGSICLPGRSRRWLCRTSGRGPLQRPVVHVHSGGVVTGHGGMWVRVHCRRRGVMVVALTLQLRIRSVRWGRILRIAVVVRRRGQGYSGPRKKSKTQAFRTHGDDTLAGCGAQMYKHEQIQKKSHKHTFIRQVEAELAPVRPPSDQQQITSEKKKSNKILMYKKGFFYETSNIDSQSINYT